MEQESEKRIEFTAFVGWGFQALILAIGTWGVTELSTLSKSVQELNVKMAVTMERDIMRGEEMRVFRARLDAIEAANN
jgi:hypothetical protein